MRNWLAYLGLRAGVALVGVLPWEAVRSLGRAVGGLWARFDPTRRSMAQRHLERVTGHASRSAAVELMRSYGVYFAEALWARPHRHRKIYEATEVEGVEWIRKARDEGTGMIFALPHMGNWEAAAPIAQEENIPIMAVAEKLPNERITDWFTRMRGQYGIEIVLATGRLEVMRRIEEGVAEGKGVALVSDRDLRGKGVPVEFFGETTTMPPGPATLAVRTGAPLMPVGCYITPTGYRVVVHEPLQIPEGSRSEQVEEVTQSLAAAFEQIIRQAPTQWHLVVPNWPSDRR